jgi:hypothetical protein
MLQTHLNEVEHYCFIVDHHDRTPNIRHVFNTSPAARFFQKVLKKFLPLPHPLAVVRRFVRDLRSCESISQATAFVVKEITPPVYKLPEGLHPGDVVKLLEFSPGYWTVERESDGLRAEISMALIDRVLK